MTIADCKSVVVQLQKLLDGQALPKKIDDSELWERVHQLVQGGGKQFRVRWIPSHLSEEGGEVKRKRYEEAGIVTAKVVLGNDYADELAKGPKKPILTSNEASCTRKVEITKAAYFMALSTWTEFCRRINLPDSPDGEGINNPFAGNGWEDSLNADVYPMEEDDPFELISQLIETDREDYEVDLFAERKLGRPCMLQPSNHQRAVGLVHHGVENPRRQLAKTSGEPWEPPPNELPSETSCSGVSLASPQEAHHAGGARARSLTTAEPQKIEDDVMNFLEELMNEAELKRRFPSHGWLDERATEIQSHNCGVTWATLANMYSSKETQVTANRRGANCAGRRSAKTSASATVWEPLLWWLQDITWSMKASGEAQGLGGASVPAPGKKWLAFLPYKRETY